MTATRVSLAVRVERSSESFTQHLARVVLFRAGSDLLRLEWSAVANRRRVAVSGLCSRSAGRAEIAHQQGACRSSRSTPPPSHAPASRLSP